MKKRYGRLFYTLRGATMGRLLAFSCITLLILGGVMVSLLYVMEYRSSLSDSESAVGNAGSHVNVLADSLNNISSMVAYSAITQDALSAYKQNHEDKPTEGFYTLFASTAQYIRLIDNFVLLDYQYDYYTSMFILTDEQKAAFSAFVEQIPEEQKNGRSYWYVFDGDYEGMAALVRVIFSSNSPTYTPLGYLMITLDLKELYSVAQQYHYKDSSTLLITDQDGAILYDAKGAENSESLDASLLQGDMSQYVKINGSTVLSARSDVLRNGWVLVELTPNSAVFRSVWQWTGLGLLIFSIATLIFGIVLMLITRSITAPFGKMKQAMELIEKGNFDIPSFHGVGIQEIDVLLKRFSDMSRQLNDTVEEMYRVRLRENELIVSAQQSELKMLQQQINPHFLYNTLDSIKWMICLGANEEASQMIIALSDFFRFTVSEYTNMILVRQEIDFAKNYMYLQRHRFGTSLKMEFSVAPEAEKYLTLRLILQPVIENSIVHGIMRDGRQGIIRVSVSLRDRMLYIVVQDNGVGMSEDTLRDINDDACSRSIGLPNIRRRLKLVFNDRFRFEIQSVPGEGTCVTIAFPAVQSEEELAALMQTGGSQADVQLPPAAADTESK